ncbi:MAG: hypothetical protein JWP89_2623 [Schlesneria sp.]|nr:hypothetical protein [Schlesneria sp.]
MPWEDTIKSSQYHIDEAKAAFEKAKALEHRVANNWCGIAFAHCKLAILSLGDKATDELKIAAEEIRETGTCKFSVPTLIDELNKLK